MLPSNTRRGWRWWRVPPSRSVLLAGMQGSVLPIAVAHGEGRAEFDPGSSAADLMAQRRVALQYVDNREQPTQVYPFNPNGSALGLAGLCSADGRVTSVMPQSGARVPHGAELLEGQGVGRGRRLDAPVPQCPGVRGLGGGWGGGDADD